MSQRIDFTTHELNKIHLFNINCLMLLGSQEVKLKLTKSRFVTALTCPTKLYYTANNSFSDKSIEDPFLEALAEGGFQVGELAKLYFPDGIEVNSLDSELASNTTKKLLENVNVTIFEAAIAYKNCFIRVDILQKSGDQINIYEVKAKSFNSSKQPGFLKKNGEPKAVWKDYLYDAAFQKWVCLKAFPNWNVSAHLMLADKAQRTSISGLNQLFKIVENNGRKRVEVNEPPSPSALSPKLLTAVNLNEVCEKIYLSTDHGLGREETFDQLVQRLSNACEHKDFISPTIGTKCANCEFTASFEEKESGKRDGRQHCFQTALNIESDIFLRPNVFELWNYRGKDKLINEGKLLLEQMDASDLEVVPAEVGLSNSERQFLQIQKAKTKDATVFFDDEGLFKEMQTWEYPLHFIDFETTMVAIPFGANQAPYEGIAFQFSHHTVEADGKVTHAGEFLSAEPGKFPNFDFVRSLRYQLSDNNGTIFRYSAHENTYLNLILEQLQNESYPAQDKHELIAFIKSIASPSAQSKDQWSPDREMVDLLELVKKYYFDPAAKGSNSIKHILPSVLRWSDFLQTKYSKPIYGAKNGIVSKNFQNWSWIQKTPDGLVKDPYDLLPKLFTNVTHINERLLMNGAELKNGGAALMAYAKMQFEHMSDYERKELQAGLLKYCELDTLAMVMIYEAWAHHV